MDNKELNSALKTARDVGSTDVKPNGFVYSYLNKKKDFFPLEKLPIASKGNMTISDLVELVEKQGKYIVELEKKLNKRIDELGQAKIIE